MRVVVQRSGYARCVVDGKVNGEIPSGLVVLVSIDIEDTDKDIDWMGNKIAGLRIFEDTEGKMNRSILDIQSDWESGGKPSTLTRPGILSISQFTLHGDVRKGFRPSFGHAASPDKGKEYYDKFNDDLRARGLFIAEGIFGAMMDIHIVNKGPVTILIDSKKND
jgi:D-aminoacyl-tRNA deacylase